MALSCSDNTSYTDSELQQVFGNGIVIGLLPASKFSSSDRESDGRLSSKALQGILTNLQQTGVIPNVSQASEKKQEEFLKQIQDESCFYYSRYKYSLQKLLQAIQQGYAEPTSDKKQLVTQYLVMTQMLNQKLNDLVQIMNGITTEMLSSTSTIQSKLEDVSKVIETQKEKLQYQHKVLSSSEATKKLSKDMVRYTEEKAKYTDNLLSLYSVLNIVALGLLVYVYKSSD